MAPSSFAPYNFTIPDQSPAFQYAPYRDGSIESGWNVSYTGSNDSAYISGVAQSIPSGTSFHRTTLAGASVNISWTGTAVYLYGQAPASAYTTTLDGGAAQTGSPNPDQQLLATYAGLKYGDHTLTLDVVASQEVRVQAAVLTVGVGSEGYSSQNHTINAISKSLSTSLSDVDPSLDLGGQWSVLDTSVNSSLVYPYLVSNQPGSSITSTLNNTSAFLIYGDCYHDHGAYSVTVKDTTNSSAPVVSQSFNASSRWLEDECILYFQSGMDRDKTYEMEFQSTSGGVQSIHRIETLDGSPSKAHAGASSSLSTSPGVIAGIVIAITAALAVLVALLIVIFRIRRRRLNRRMVDLIGPDAEASSDAGAEAGIIKPYTADLSQGLHTPSISYPGSEKSELDTAHLHSRSSSASTRATRESSDRPPPPPMVHSRPLSDPAKFRQTTAHDRSGVRSPPPRTRARATSNLEKALPPDPHFSRPTRVVPTVDAGPVVELLPPTYNPAWARDGRLQPDNTPSSSAHV